MLRTPQNRAPLRTSCCSRLSYVGRPRARPFTFFAIRLFRTIHPVVIRGGNAEAQGGFDMTSSMLTAMFVALIAFTVIFVDLYWNRIRLGDLEDKVEQLKLKVTM